MVFTPTQASSPEHLHVKHLQEEDPVLDSSTDESSSTTSTTESVHRSMTLLDSASYAHHHADEFTAFRLETLALFLRLTSDSEPGVRLDFNKKEGPVELWKGSVTDSPWAILKATVTIRASLDTISTIVYDLNNITDIDEMVKVATVVEDISNDISIRHVSAKPVFPTTARDFVVCSTRTVLDERKSVVITTKSIEHPDVVPERRTHVRANMHISGYLIEQLDDGSSSCKVTLICHTNLGGSVPSALINTFSTSAPLKLMQNMIRLSEATAGKKDNQ